MKKLTNFEESVYVIAAFNFISVSAEMTHKEILQRLNEAAEMGDHENPEGLYPLEEYEGWTWGAIARNTVLTAEYNLSKIREYLELAKKNMIANSSGVFKARYTVLDLEKHIENELANN